MTDKRISILVPYFGQVPKSYQTFLNSIGEDLPLTFHVISDQAFPKDRYGKVVVHNMSFRELRMVFERKLGFAIALDRPYKLCDFRPLYGKLFEEIVGGSDYWGWGDVDTVMGDLRRWIDPLISQSFDVISFKKLWLSGSLTILKNRTEVNDAFKSIPIWKTVVTTAPFQGFDECSRRWADHLAAGDLDAVRLEPMCLTRIFWAQHRLGNLKVSMNEVAKEWIGPEEKVGFSKENNRVYCMQSNMDYPYYHSVCENGRPEFRWPTWRGDRLEFFITREGYWEREEQITLFNRNVRKLRGLAVRTARALRRRVSRLSRA